MNHWNSFKKIECNINAKKIRKNVIFLGHCSIVYPMIFYVFHSRFILNAHSHIISARLIVHYIIKKVNSLPGYQLPVTSPVAHSCKYEWHLLVDRDHKGNRPDYRSWDHCAGEICLAPIHKEIIHLPLFYLNQNDR